MRKTSFMVPVIKHQAYPAKHIINLWQYSSCGKKWMPSSGHLNSPSQGLVLLSHWLISGLNHWPCGHVLGTGRPSMHIKKCSQPASLGRAVLFSTPSQILLLQSQDVYCLIPFAFIPIAKTAANTMAMKSDSEMKKKKNKFLKSLNCVTNTANFVFFHLLSIACSKWYIPPNKKNSFRRTLKTDTFYKIANHFILVGVQRTLVWQLYRKTSICAPISIRRLYSTCIQ